jgi:tellurite resistance protein
MTDPVDADLNDLSEQDALLGLMILSSMSDGVVRISELVAIENVLDHFPIFSNYDKADINKVFAVMDRLLGSLNGIDRFLTFLKSTLPPNLHETAYAIACDVVAADGKLEQAELRLLEEIEHHLSLDPLYVAAIERSTRARYAKL